MVSNKSLPDLNNANRKLLTQLPGVPKDVAYRIVNYRKRHGGFSSWADVENAIGFSHQETTILQTRASLGPRPTPISHERRIISRWRGKTDDELHNHA